MLRRQTLQKSTARAVLAAIPCLVAPCLAAADAQPPTEGRPEVDASRLVEVPVAAGKLDVSSLGDEPRVLLRPALALGDTFTLEFSIESLATKVGDRFERQMVRPLTVRWGVELSVTGREETGALKLKGVVRKAELVVHPSNTPAQIEQVRSAVQPLVEKPIELELGPEGGLLALRLPAAAVPASGLADPVRLFVEGLRMILRPQPAEPVGVGATWQVQAQRQIQEVDRIETATLSVHMVVGATVTVALTETVLPPGPRAMVSDQRVPEGRLAVVASMEGTGGGAITWDGKGFLPAQHREQRLVTTIFEALVPDETGRAGGEKRSFIEEKDMTSMRLGIRPLVVPQAPADRTDAPGKAEQKETGGTPRETPDRAAD